MDEFETIESDWAELEANGIEESFAELSEPTADELEDEFAAILGY